MKKIGVWLDKEKAYLVTLTAKEIVLLTLPSELEFFNLKSGGPGRVKSGATQDVVHESTYLEREKQQLKAYFKQLVPLLEGAEAILIFGPADTNEKLKKELDKNYKSIAANIISVQKADSMTPNQVKAYVRHFFEKNS
jgi:hypothetical protein